ncbi:MAG TPA: type III polyketide synthase [Aestuariivirga sp.]
MEDSRSIGLSSLATAFPPNVLEQSSASAIAKKVFSGRMDDFERLEGVFKNSGIDRRYAAMPLEWYLSQRGWDERSEAFLTVATELFITAAKQAADEAGLLMQEIDTVVTVSSTGIATPTIEARAAKLLNLRADVMRVPIFGLGCAGGVTGLGIAAQLASARPGTNVLLVVVELCTLAFRLDKFTPANVVATALFGDGAAAAILRKGVETKVTIEGALQHMWPDTLGIMGWNVDSTGFEVVFDRAIPPFVRRNIKPVMEEFLEKWGIQQANVPDLFRFHPGGTKVIEAMENALDFLPGSLDIERDILREYGNMSSPTALFVLQRALAREGSSQLVLSALGPGFTASSVLLRRAA